MWTVIHPVSFLHTLAILHFQLRVQPFFSFLRFIGRTKKKRLLQPAVDIICEHRDRALSCFSENPRKCLHGIRAMECFEKTTIMSMRCNIKRLGYGLRKFWILCTGELGHFRRQRLPGQVFSCPNHYFLCCLFSRFCSMFRLRPHQNMFDYVIVHVAMDTYCHTCAYQNAAQALPAFLIERDITLKCTFKTSFKRFSI